MATPLHHIQRPNWIEIHLDGLLSNVALMRTLVPSGTRILFPVKADAYGHGSLACSWAAVHAGVDYLGVAHLSEAVLLRQYGIPLPILVLGPCVAADFPYLREWSLIPTVAELSTAQKLSALATPHDPLKVHFKVNTGMHRYGFDWEDASGLELALQLPGLEVEGLFSHMANSDVVGHPLNTHQIERFRNLVQDLERKGLRPPICHIANSGAVFHYPESAFDMVRPGIAIYGCNPVGAAPCAHPLIPVLRMKATVRQVHTVATGESISYGSSWVADRTTRVASVAIGYGDGFSRGIPSEGHFYLRGRACPILGKVCMDTTMIDVSHLDEVCVGDEVHVIDGALHPSLSVESLAERLGTIPYELTCRVARRLYRKYHWKNRLMRWDDVRQELGVSDFQELPAISLP